MNYFTSPIFLARTRKLPSGSARPAAGGSFFFALIGEEIISVLSPPRPQMRWLDRCPHANDGGASSPFFFFPLSPLNNLLLREINPFDLWKPFRRLWIRTPAASLKFRPLLERRRTDQASFFASLSSLLVRSAFGPFVRSPLP